jgi:hypothetical protein
MTLYGKCEVTHRTIISTNMFLIQQSTRCFDRCLQLWFPSIFPATVYESRSIQKMDSDIPKYQIQDRGKNNI